MTLRDRRSMPRLWILWVIIPIAVCCVAGSEPETPPVAISGFSAATARRQSDYEQRLKALISPDRTRDFHRIFTAEPHPAGSERNNELARYVADTWKEQGLEDVVIHRYDVLNTAPRDIVVEMLSPTKY